MVQEMFKEIAHFITFAMQLDVTNNAQKMQLVAFPGMELGHKEIVVVIHSVTLMAYVLRYVQ